MRQFGPLLIIFLIFISSSCSDMEEGESVELADTNQIASLPEVEYGFVLDSFDIFFGKIGRNEFLADILTKYDVPYSTVHEIAQRSKDVFDVRKLGRGKNYLILCSKDSSCEAQCFIYEANDIDYVVYDFSGDSVMIRTGQKEVDITEKRSEGIIQQSLYQTLQDSGHNVLLAFEMADIFAWTIDFYRLQPGDHYDIIYRESSVDGKVIGIAGIEAVKFNHEGRDFMAYYFEQDSTGGDYFDEEAQSLRKAFLKSPLKFSRLTSGYTRRRFHPVQKRWKAHLGTDYAAPRGTPIMSTGDGVIVEARYKRFNGNYVKIRHNSVFMTQYLHMNKIASGIKPGAYVKQGDIIGYVGSTGLATGPHVCYRFWKNGSQVNHLREEFPPSEPVREEHLSRYRRRMEEVNLKFRPYSPA